MADCGCDTPPPRTSVSANPTRRAVIRSCIAGAAGLPLTFALGLPDADASVFSAQERETLAAAADALVPGAAKAGVAEFVTAMMSDPDPASCYRFLSLPIPPRIFYTQALRAIAALARVQHGTAFAKLGFGERERFVAALAGPHLEGWNGPPASLVYFVIRNDALDMVYGGDDVYVQLDVPYMPHILPPARW